MPKTKKLDPYLAPLSQEELDPYLAPLSPEELKTNLAASPLSIGEAAEILDVTRQTIYNWINGVHPITRTTSLAFRLLFEKVK